MGLRRVVGAGLDGSTVTLTIGKIEVPAISASYGDKLDKAKLAHMGAQQTDEITLGTYDAPEGEIKVSSVTFRSIIMPAMPPYAGGNVRLPIIVGFEHPDLGSDSDFLEDCYLNNWAQAVQNSNAAFEVPLKVTIRQIYWTDQRKTINQLRGLPPPSPGLSAF